MGTGTNSKGSYREFADGTLEMWGTIPVSEASITTKSGNIFITPGYTFNLAVCASFSSTSGAWIYSVSCCRQVEISFDLESLIGLSFAGNLNCNLYK